MLPYLCLPIARLSGIISGKIRGEFPNLVRWDVHCPPGIILEPVISNDRTIRRHIGFIATL